MSDYPTMEITIKLLFTPCASGVQYQSQAHAIRR
jgi:hypothetical protein